jgi:uncharacterized protein (DUF427 family)
MSLPRGVVPDVPGPGQESVWDYPRPPALRRSAALVIVVLGGHEIARTTQALQMLETSHPPTWYLPLQDIVEGTLRPSPGASVCEWKGRASYFDVVGGDRISPSAAWTYSDPVARYAELRDHVAFYAAAMDRCTVDGEVVTPQPGGFYGGWVTSAVAGPVKGVPGSTGW